MESDLLDFLVQPKDLITTNRPLRLRLDCSTQLSDDMLLPQRVYGAESICGGLEYRILCVSARAQLPLKEFIGLPAALDFVTDRGGLRSICGIITEIAAGDSDGGLASYQLVLRDVLSIMDKRTNTRVFRNKDEVEIVQLILDEWRLGNRIAGICFKHELGDFFDTISYPKREFTMQHNESDGAFIRRLLKRRGISWYFRADHGERTLFHTMVLLNRPDSVRENAAGAVRYHRDSATEERDSITSWSAVRTLQPGSTATHSWDYRNPLGVHFMSVAALGDADQGSSGRWMAASMDDYQVLPPHAGDDHEDLFKLGQLRMQRHDYETKCFHAEGSVRDLCVGEYFTLEGHPEISSHAAEERDFTVTALQVTAQNNLPKALAARVERLFARNRWMRKDADGAHDAQLRQELAGHVAEGSSRMHIQFTAVRRGVPIVPAYDPRSDLPQPQMQSAIVVGPEGEEVHCDEMGRVKIRFPGTRAQDHGDRGLAGTTNDECDSAWVRVASNWAGNGPGHQSQCGTLGLPRIGSEVLVAFLGGDPDKPVIVGQLYNQEGLPPALSILDGLPGNKHLSGMKSREIHGSRANQLRFDDTTGQISAQLASDHGRSELNLGYLTQPKECGYGVLRGLGAELRSDQKVAVRGEEGVLITAEVSDGENQQLGRIEFLEAVKRITRLVEQLSAMAEKHAKDPPQSPQLSGLVSKLEKLDEITSQIVAVRGPDGVLVSSGQGFLADAAKGVDIVSGEDTTLSSAGATSIRSANGLSLFSNERGAKLIAASGRMQLQAQGDAMELIAKRVLDIISATDWINLTAKEGIRINAGGSELVLDAQGIRGSTGGTFEVHALEHRLFGGAGADASADHKFPELSKLLSEKSWVEIALVDGDTPLKGQRYILTDPDGIKHQGVLDDVGCARIDSVSAGHCKVEFPDIGRTVEVTA